MRKDDYRNILGKLNAYSLLSVAFLIPFHSFLNRYLLGVFVVSSIILYILQPVSIQLKKHKGLICLFFLFFIYAVSFFYSINLNLAWIDLEKKLPLLLVPLALIIVKPDRIRMNQLYWAFLTGVLAVTLICAGSFIFRTISDAHFHRVLTNHPFYQMYSKFYIFGNVNYYAVYLNMAVLLMLGMLASSSYQTRDKRIKWFLYFGLILFLSLSMIISSRSGIIAVVILLMFSVFYLIKLRYFRLVSLVLLVLAGLYIARNYRFNNYIQLFDRMIHSAEQISEKELLEKSVLRLIFWKASTRIIGEKVWFGVGTGDVKYQIKAAYKDMGVYEELHENDDPHNQFLRTFIATGIPGFLALIGIFLYGFLRGIKSRDYLLLAFMILIVIHFIFKSMLFRENGVVFFSFFYGLLYTANIPENPEN